MGQVPAHQTPETKTHKRTKLSLRYLIAGLNIDSLPALALFSLIGFGYLRKESALASEGALSLLYKLHTPLRMLPDPDTPRAPKAL